VGELIAHKYQYLESCYGTRREQIILTLHEITTLQDGFDVADGAVSEADGAGGGQTTQTLAKAKSRRWRDGGKGTCEAVARLNRATAWFRMRMR
ncbi:MAG: hypothetical protein Q8N07_08875, partial [Rhodocyclaceae bacterium]|nr:hypothetical protein [Rhodocyclaceae bacterium]